MRCALSLRELRAAVMAVKPAAVADLTQPEPRKSSRRRRRQGGGSRSTARLVTIDTTTTPGKITITGGPASSMLIQYLTIFATVQPQMFTEIAPTAVTVSLVNLSRVLGHLPMGTIELEIIEGRELVIHSRDDRYSIEAHVVHHEVLIGQRVLRDPEEADASYEVDEETVAELRCMEAFASNDDLRPILCGVNFDPEGHLTVTDSYRLAVYHLDVEAWPDLLIPKGTLRYLPRKGAWLFHVWEANSTRPWIGWDDGDVRYFVQCIEGAYPDWRSLLGQAADEPRVRVEFDRRDLLEIVGLIAAIVPDDAGPSGCVKLTCDETDRSRLWLRAGAITQPAIGQSVEVSVPCRLLTRGVIDVALNPFFLLDTLRAFETDRLTMACVDSMRPLIFGDGLPLTVLMMPVRTS